MTKLSVIVPAYNVEAYLEECLDSILSQGVEDMEILVIDDCSPDASGEIAEAAAAADKRVKVIHLEENVGLGPARNLGIEKASGEWIAFLDGDDMMQPDALVRLLDTASERKPDITLGLVDCMTEDASCKRRIYKYQTSVFFQFVAHKANLYTLPALINIPPCWSMLYSRAFLDGHNIRFRRRFQEDHDFVLNAFLEADNISVRGDVPYIYYRKDRPGSITAERWSEERFAMMADHIATAAGLLSEERYARKFPNLPALKKTRMSYYLGILVNSILPELLSVPNAVETNAESLDVLARAFADVRLAETEIDPEAESIARRRELFDNGYYGLCLRLITGKNWRALQTLFAAAGKGVPIDEYAAVIADESIPAETREAFAKYFAVNREALVLPPSAPPAIIPFHVDETIVHIGMTKTGSTALQNFLEINREVLKSHGVLYPRTGIYREERKDSARTAGHQELIRATWEDDHDFMARFQAEISVDKSIRKVIISAENMFHDMKTDKQIATLRECIGGARAKVVVYLRRQDMWLESMYAEAICGSHAKECAPFQVFVDKLRARGALDYDKILQRWAKHFGKENIIVRSYDEVIKAGGIIEDFCSLFDLQAVSPYQRRTTSARHANHAPLDKEDLILLRMLNQLPFASKEEGYRPFVHDFIGLFGSPKTKKKILWFDGKSRQRLLSECAKINKVVAEEYHAGKPLFDNSMPEEAQTRPGDEDASIPAEKLRQALALYNRYAHAGETPAADTRVKTPAADTSANICQKRWRKKMIKLHNTPERFFAESKKLHVRLMGALVTNQYTGRLARRLIRAITTPFVR